MKKILFVIIAGLSVVGCNSESSRVNSLSTKEQASRTVLSAKAPYDGTTKFNDVTERNVKLNATKSLNDAAIDRIVDRIYPDADVKSKIVSKKEKKDLKGKHNLQLEQFTDDSSFVVVELSGELSPPPHARPLNEDGSPKNLVFKKGILVVDPENEKVYDSVLFDRVQ